MDDSLVKTIRLSQYDRFYFSLKYDREKVHPLLHQAQYLNLSMKELPLLPELADRLKEEITRRSIYGTAAIEGNPLSEEEVGRVLSREDTFRSKREAEQEIENIKKAYRFIDTLRSTHFYFYLTEELIQEIHCLLTTELDDSRYRPGKYRHEPRKVGDRDHGGTDIPPKRFADIVLLMREFIVWINSEEILNESPIIRAGLAHYHIGLIHPFLDGNGRTARLMETLLLQASNIQYAAPMLSDYYHRFIDDYYWAFSLSRKNKEKEVTPFLEFYLKALLSSLGMIKSRVLEYIHSVVLRDYAVSLRKGKKITQRQQDLLNILLEKPRAFSASDLFGIASFAILYRGKSERTARRDLAGLLTLNLLIQTEEGKYELNTRVLDTL